LTTDQAPDEASGQEYGTYSAGQTEGSMASGTAEERAQSSVETTAAEPVLDAKWYQDSDGNYVPDFIEAAKDFDPDRNDWAPEGCPGAAQSIDFYTGPSNALLILDSSGSMVAGDGTGRTRMEAAREFVLRYSELSSVVYDTGFAVFGNTGDATKSGRTRSCSDAADRASQLLDQWSKMQEEYYRAYNEVYGVG
jgi:hypothetical protein